ncbi:MAG: hypothetical protein PHF86_06605 [Candidatus Nanoarchaeia archaeon]|jgi:hypothetical protein|nr:hypothetical protein [Candidatus Nanoarchaeia archaeon]
MIKIHYKYWGINVKIGPNLLRTGWYGGQIVRFVDKMTVEKALPNETVGLLINGYKLEDYDGKQYDFKDMDGLATARRPYKYENSPVDSSNHSASMISDDVLLDFNRNAYDTTRIYTYNQKLYVNSNGILTNENIGGNADVIGIVGAIPGDLNGWLRAKIKW